MVCAFAVLQLQQLQSSWCKACACNQRAGICDRGTFSVALFLLLVAVQLAALNSAAAAQHFLVVWRAHMLLPA
jgi:hypothetical protein